MKLVILGKHFGGMGDYYVNCPKSKRPPPFNKVYVKDCRKGCGCFILEVNDFVECEWEDENDMVRIAEEHLDEK